MVLTTRPSATARVEERQAFSLPLLVPSLRTRIKLWRTGAAAYPGKSLDDRRSTSRNTESIFAEGVAHFPQPGKKTAREESHGGQKETDAEEAGGSVTNRRIALWKPRNTSG